MSKPKYKENDVIVYGVALVIKIISIEGTRYSVAFEEDNFKMCDHNKYSFRVIDGDSKLLPLYNSPLYLAMNETEDEND